MRSAILSSAHYASTWKTDAPLRSVEDVNELGRQYAVLPDSDPAKEEKLLEILQCFHPYVMKYLSMICRGHVPLWGNRVNRDVAPFLRYFMPKGAEMNKATLTAVARHLHLAFKGLETDEIYDALIACVLKAVRRYDPNYTDKVRQAVETINAHFSRRKQFTSDAVSGHMGFNGDRYLRLLMRRGFLVPVAGETGRAVAFARSGTWPPPPEFFSSGAVGFTYYLQLWFRYFLQEHIDQQMGILENREGVYSLDYNGEDSDGEAFNNYADRLPDSDDQSTAPVRLDTSAELHASEDILDVSKLTLDWVADTRDPLFADLRREDRHLLYLVFTREPDWSDIGRTFSMTPHDAKAWFRKIIAGLQKKARE